MKCQILFSGKNKKNNIILSSAENAQRVVKVKMPATKTADNILIFFFFFFFFHFFFFSKKRWLHISCPQEWVLDFLEKVKKLSKNNLTCPANHTRWLCKQCRSRWDGSWWAISSGSALFAMLFLIFDWHLICKNRIGQILLCKVPFSNSSFSPVPLFQLLYCLFYLSSPFLLETTQNDRQGWCVVKPQHN